MESIVKFFFKAKHWQLFLLFYVFPFILFVIFIIILIVDNIDDPNFIKYEFEANFNIFQGIWTLLKILFFTWLYSIGEGLQRITPPHAQMNTFWFKTMLVLKIFLTYLFVIALFKSAGTYYEMDPQEVSFLSLFLKFIFYIFDFLLLLFLCAFTAKSFRNADLQRKTTVSDYIAETVLMLITFIGVWFIQPRVNELAEKYGLLEDEEYEEEIT